MNPAYGYAAALLIGFGSAWYVQGLRWDTDVQQRDLSTAAAISANVEAVNQHLVESRAQTEQIRQEYLAYREGKEHETDSLMRDVAAGKRRLLVAAKCPTVPATGAVPGGTGEGTAELTADSRSAYFELRRGLDRQFAELQFCRSELRKRSTPR